FGVWVSIRCVPHDYKMPRPLPHQTLYNRPAIQSKVREFCLLSRRFHGFEGKDVQKYCEECDRGDWTRDASWWKSSQHPSHTHRPQEDHQACDGSVIVRSQSFYQKKSDGESSANG